MKRLFLFLFILFPLSLFAVKDALFLKKIENAQTKSEKETAYLEWVSELSQSNTQHCDSIISQRHEYIVDISDDGKLALLIIFLNNSQSGGRVNLPKIEEYNFKPSDAILVDGVIKCFTNQSILKSDFQKIKNNLSSYDDPTRKSLYYALSTCREGLNKQGKIQSYNTALKHAKRSHLKSVFSSIINELSKYFVEVEDFEQAIHHQQLGVAYSKKHNLKSNLINHLINLAQIHFQLGDLNKSKEALLEALQLSLELKLDYTMGLLYNQLGEVYNAQGKLSESIRFFQQSLLRFYKIENKQGLASVHKNIGKAYFTNGDIGLAEKNYQLSENFAKQQNGKSDIGELHYFMAELYLSINKLSLAEEHIRKSIECWKDSELFIPLNKAFYLYAKIEHQQGNIKNAYAYLDRYMTFRDSIYNTETKKKVAELSELFQSEQKERKIAEQEKKLEEELSQRLLVQNKLENSKQQNRLIVIILVISLVLFVAIFVIIRNRNKQEQLIKKQREIELQQTLLRTQMNPHFIFNAMSVIQSYIYDEDVANSSKFLIHFSKLMRMILENNTKEFIPLITELEIIDRYLVLQKMRFEDRFDFEITDDEISDVSVLSIPPMLVQPFIENAIEHGDLDKVDNGFIRVNCQVSEDLFIFTIEDNGIGRQAAVEKKKTETSENHRSMAIQLTQDRISLLNEKYKGNGFLRIEDLDVERHTGTKVTIAIPFITNY
jgi:tetratricopeptide (TPR) repeat protein